jgi:hypothetical protein
MACISSNSRISNSNSNSNPCLRQRLSFRGGGLISLFNYSILQC